MERSTIIIRLFVTAGNKYMRYILQVLGKCNECITFMRIIWIKLCRHALHIHIFTCKRPMSQRFLCLNDYGKKQKTIILQWFSWMIFNECSHKPDFYSKFTIILSLSTPLILNQFDASIITTITDNFHNCNWNTL